MDFSVISSSLDLISSSKGHLETCMKSSVAERQFQFQNGIICFVSDSHWLGLRELVSWADQNPCLADILIFGAAGTVLNSSSLRHFFWDSSGLLTIFLGSGWLDFSCQFRGVAMASPGLVWVSVGSGLALRCSPTSIVRMK